MNESASRRVIEELVVTASNELRISRSLVYRLVARLRTAAAGFHEFESMDRPPVHELIAAKCHSLRFKCSATAVQHPLNGDQTPSSFTDTNQF
jgi:hypothetical protein